MKKFVMGVWAPLFLLSALAFATSLERDIEASCGPRGMYNFLKDIEDSAALYIELKQALDAALTDPTVSEEKKQEALQEFNSEAGDIQKTLEASAAACTVILRARAHKPYGAAEVLEVFLERYGLLIQQPY
ncbi:MAG: hypothetical protein ACK5Y2_13330 [Bdellovibrionales bacterium]